MKSTRLDEVEKKSERETRPTRNNGKKLTSDDGRWTGQGRGEALIRSLLAVDAGAPPVVMGSAPGRTGLEWRGGNPLLAAGPLDLHCLRMRPEGEGDADSGVWIRVWARREAQGAWLDWVRDQRETLRRHKSESSGCAYGTWTWRRGWEMRTLGKTRRDKSAKKAKRLWETGPFPLGILYAYFVCAVYIPTDGMHPLSSELLCRVHRSPSAGARSRGVQRPGAVWVEHRAKG